MPVISDSQETLQAVQAHSQPIPSCQEGGKLCGLKFSADASGHLLTRSAGAREPPSETLVATFDRNGQRPTHARSLGRATWAIAAAADKRR